MNETRNWTWHLFTAIIIFVLLGLHMLVMHLDDILGWFSSDPNALNWSNVIARSQRILFVIIYTMLLGAALYHGLYGLRSILLELNPKPIVRTMTWVLFWLLGLLFFALGTTATFITYAQA